MLDSDPRHDSASPLVNVFQTNFVPSLVEVGYIRRLLVSQEKRLKQVDDLIFMSRSILAHLHHSRLWLDNHPSHAIDSSERSWTMKTEIAVVRNTLSQLLDEQSNLRHSIDSHKALLSPIRRMPVEIMSEIFLWCIPTDGLARFDKTDGNPQLFALVSKLWRRLVHSTPSLWAGLNLGSCPNAGYCARHLGTWLARSNSLPLSFKLCSTNWGLPQDKAIQELAIVQIAKSLSEHHRRWRHVEIEVGARWTCLILQCMSQGTPLLETIHLLEATGTEHPSIIVDISAAPLLNLVSVRGKTAFTMGVFLTFANSPSVNLRDLSFNSTCLAFDNFFYVLQHCPALVRCNVELGVGINDMQTMVGGGDMLSLRHLLPLAVRVNSGTNPGILLDYLHLPALKIFSLIMPERPKEPHWRHLTSLFQRSKPQLQRLEISGGPMEEADLLECLAHIPELRSLSALGVYYTDLLSAGLTVTRDGGLCTRLENLELSRCRALSPNPLAAMLASRCKRTAIDLVPPTEGVRSTIAALVPFGGCLDRVRLWNCSPELFEGRYPEISECLRNGMEFCLNSGWSWY